MPRYFIEVAYVGTRYSGFQAQKNANTIQSEVEKALRIFFKGIFVLTGASRTDAGVHALQNYFHFDTSEELIKTVNSNLEHEEWLKRCLYSLNSILPEDIVIKNIAQVEDNAHSRFDAITREYKYQIYQSKNPFLRQVAYYYPYKLDVQKLQEAAEIILASFDFTSFSKKNTQVTNFNCFIHKSNWIFENNLIIYNIIGNRFLRGMVRGLVATMLNVGNGKISVEKFRDIINAKDCTKANFSIPPRGLFLVEVTYRFII
ncbi:MAG: tRNA pseudouridine(38-40) synthase TruA [Ginsengibacter sp.]